MPNSVRVRCCLELVFLQETGSSQLELDHMLAEGLLRPPLSCFRLLAQIIGDPLVLVDHGLDQVRCWSRARQSTSRCSSLDLIPSASADCHC